eukprot:6385460-Amphidinium_carterae.1
MRSKLFAWRLQLRIGFCIESSGDTAAAGCCFWMFAGFRCTRSRPRGTMGCGWHLGLINCGLAARTRLDGCTSDGRQGSWRGRYLGIILQDGGGDVSNVARI